MEPYDDIPAWRFVGAHQIGHNFDRILNVGLQSLLGIVVQLQMLLNGPWRRWRWRILFRPRRLRRNRLGCRGRFHSCGRGCRRTGQLAPGKRTIRRDRWTAGRLDRRTASDLHAPRGRFRRPRRKRAGLWSQQTSGRRPPRPYVEGSYCPARSSLWLARIRVIPGSLVV